MDIGFAEKKENPVEQRIEQIFDVVQGIQDHLNQTGEILNTWKNDPIKKNHILSQMREENIYQKLDIYISGIRFYGAKDSEDVLQDGTNAMHDQRTRNR